MLTKADTFWMHVVPKLQGADPDEQAVPAPNGGDAIQQLSQRSIDFAPLPAAILDGAFKGEL